MRAESVIASRRASKKLINWIADTQELLANNVRIWIDGKLNILADVGSRLGWESAVAKHTPIPLSPILETIRLFFTHPNEMKHAVAQRAREMDSEPWVPLNLYDTPPRVPVENTPMVDSQANASVPRTDSVADPRAKQRASGGRPRSSPSSKSSTVPSSDFVDIPESFFSDASNDDTNDEATEYFSCEDDAISKLGADSLRARPLPDIYVNDTQLIHKAKESRDRYAKMLKQSFMGISYFGTSYCFHFLEVCSGSARLTQAVKICNLTTLACIDIIDGWDLTKPTVLKHCLLYTSPSPRD